LVEKRSAQKNAFISNNTDNVSPPILVHYSLKYSASSHRRIFMWPRKYAYTKASRRPKSFCTTSRSRARRCAETEEELLVLTQTYSLVQCIFVHL